MVAGFFLFFFLFFPCWSVSFYVLLSNITGKKKKEGKIEREWGKRRC